MFWVEVEASFNTWHICIKKCPIFTDVQRQKIVLIFLLVVKLLVFAKQLNELSCSLNRSRLKKLGVVGFRRKKNSTCYLQKERPSHEAACTMGVQSLFQRDHHRTWACQHFASTVAFQTIIARLLSQAKIVVPQIFHEDSTGSHCCLKTDDYGAGPSPLWSVECPTGI